MAIVSRRAFEAFEDFRKLGIASLSTDVGGDSGDFGDAVEEAFDCDGKVDPCVESDWPEAFRVPRVPISFFTLSRPESGNLLFASVGLGGAKAEAREGFGFADLALTFLLPAGPPRRLFPKTLLSGRARRVADVPFVGDEDLGLGMELPKPPLENFVPLVVTPDVSEVTLRFDLLWFCGRDGTGGTFNCLVGEDGLEFCHRLFRDTLIDEAGRDGDLIGLSVA